MHFKALIILILATPPKAASEVYLLNLRGCSFLYNEPREFPCELHCYVSELRRLRPRDKYESHCIMSKN